MSSYLIEVHYVQSSSHYMYYRALSMSGHAAALSSDHAAVWSHALLNAWSDATSGISRPSLQHVDELPALNSLEDVFLVHEAMLNSSDCKRLGGHGGWKLGWKSNPCLGADRLNLPAFYAPLFADCFISAGSTISLSQHKAFSAEAEYGFTMARALLPRATPYAEEEVWAAVGSYEPCIELCGMRGAMASPLHLLADAMNNAAVVRGTPFSTDPAVPPPDALTKRTSEVLVRLLVDGLEVASGNGTENPGHSPLASLTFLINDLTYRRGQCVEAGLLIIAGHTCQVAFEGCTAPISASTLPQAQVCRAHGCTSTLLASFDGYGTVQVTLAA